MTFLLFVLSGSTALPHPSLYGRLLSNNKEEDMLGGLDSTFSFLEKTQLKF